MKKIVTHIQPDLDAIVSVWLIKTYYPDFGQADIEFIPAGTTYQGQPVDSNPDIIHVDTGMGKFDHHQFKKRLSAGMIILDYLKENTLIPQESLPGIQKLVEYTTIIDNFEEITFPEPDHDRYYVTIDKIIDGLHARKLPCYQVVNITLECIEGLVIVLNKKASAESILKSGKSTQTVFGKTLFIETSNNAVTKLAQKQGFDAVICKDPETNYLRILGSPISNISFKKLYENIIQKDTIGTWFLHSSEKMLLNGSLKNPTMKPTPLGLDDINTIIQGL